MKTLNPLAETQCRFAMSPKFGCRYTLKEIFESLTNLRLSSRGYSRLSGQTYMRVIELKMGSFFPNIDCTGRKKKGKKGVGGEV